MNSAPLSIFDKSPVKREISSEFISARYLYVEDLDIFGDHSIFQLLNRTSTFPGKELLANRLKGENSVVDLQIYQKSVSELSNKPEIGQEYQALGRHVRATSDDFLKFNNWLSVPPRVENIPGIKYLLYILPALFIASLVVVLVYSITYYALLPSLIINTIFMVRQYNYAQEVVKSTSASLKMLRSFVHHIELIETNNFSSQFLSELAKGFSKDGQSARHEINKIAGLLEQLQVRENLLHISINIPFLLDLQWLLRIEHWQKQNKENVKEWFAALAELEVLNSLSAQAFAHDTWAYPKIDSKPYYLESVELGHPLIMSGQRVPNDFKMEGKGEIILLTGPNMAGKSTFLRTIAVNIIMAQIGGVVCANKFVFNPEMKVFTAMRIKDDLSESISSFYAELSRIKYLLDLVEQGKPVLYFLDEILKGTNSADRHKGAVALMRQLSSLQVSGFISTHDLELGNMSKKLDTVRNFSFESIITDGRIDFDYTIRPGICQSFNACELMRQMGIQV